MKGFIVTAIIAAVLLFPIFIQSYVFWDSETKKAGFAVYFAGIVRILSGYAQLYTGGIVFHLSEKKAVILPYAELLNARKKFEITRGFVVCSYKQIIEVGGAQYASAALTIGLLLRKITDLVFYGLQKKKDIKLCGEVITDMNRKGVRATIRAVIAFNLLILFIAAVKILLERLLAYGRKRKKQEGR